MMRSRKAWKKYLNTDFSVNIANLSARSSSRNPPLSKPSIWSWLGLGKGESRLTPADSLGNEQSRTKMKCVEVQEVSGDGISRGPGRSTENQTCAKFIQFRSTVGLQNFTAGS